MKKQILIATVLVVLSVIALKSQTQELQPSANNQEQASRKLRRDDPFYDRYLESRVQPSFHEWCLLYRKIYKNDEQRAYRMQVYLQNIRQINEHNILYELGKSSYFKGVNRLTDITGEEFEQTYNWKEDYSLKATNACDGIIMDAPNPPTDLDWGNKVSEVRDQGSCGMDWAMVAVEALQSLYALKVGTLPVLSTQQLLDCSVDYGNEGCDGGFMDQAFWYIIDKGIATNKTYPPSSNSTKCKYVLNMKYTGFSKCARIPKGSYSKLLSAIVQQPVSVALNQVADMRDFKGGIYDDKCTSTLNHGMLLVGYGGAQAEKYFWRLKNSLGVSWGDNGFINLKRVESDGDGKCGIQIWASVPQNLN